MPTTVVVTPEQDIYSFTDDKELYDFLNERGDYELADEKNNWEILDEFPTPVGKHNGGYCPFTAWNSQTERSLWKPGHLFLLRDGKVFVPEKRMNTRTVTEFEYAAPKVERAKRGARKAAAKKTAKKRLGRPRKNLL